MAVYAFVLWAQALLGIVDLGIYSWMLGLVSAVVSLYILCLLVAAIGDAEESRSVSIGQPTLKRAWAVMAAAHAAAQILIIFPSPSMACQIVSFAAAVFFPVYFNATRNACNLLFRGS